MKLCLSRMAALSAFWCRAHAVSSSGLSSSRSGDPGVCEDRSAASGLKEAIRELASRLLAKKKDILALMGDGCIELDDSKVRGRIESLRKSFLGALAESSFCPPLGRDAEIKVLGMSPGRFRKSLDRWYNNHARAFGHGSSLAPQTEGGEGRPPEECDREHDAKPGVHEACYRRVVSLACKTLGERSLSALYGSYLADQKDLAEKRRECAERLPFPVRSGATSSSQVPDYQGCMVCFAPFKLDSEKISCANGHELHEKCLYKWSVLQKETCPACRGAFGEDQKRRLARCAKRYTDHLCSLFSDPAFERKYVCRGADEDGNGLLEAMCFEIKSCVLNLRSHPGYATVFSNPDSSVYRRFYIPHNIVIYFENTEAGHHDPRSKGFARYRAILVRQVTDYEKHLDASLCLGAGLLSRDIIEPMHSMLNVFFAVESLLEYLCTKLHKIGDLAEKRAAIMSGAQTYPALCSLVSRHPDHSLAQIYRGLELVVRDFDTAPFLYTRQWQLMVCDTFSKAFSEIVSEIWDDGLCAPADMQQ